MFLPFLQKENNETDNSNYTKHANHNIYAKINLNKNPSKVLILIRILLLWAQRFNDPFHFEHTHFMHTFSEQIETFLNEKKTAYISVLLRKTNTCPIQF